MTFGFANGIVLFAVSDAVEEGQVSPQIISLRSGTVYLVILVAVVAAAYFLLERRGFAVGLATGYVLATVVSGGACTLFRESDDGWLAAVASIYFVAVLIGGAAVAIHAGVSTGTTDTEADAAPPAPYAGVPQRLAASVIDATILAFVFSPSLAVPDEARIALLLPVYITFWLYFALFESSSRQATPGKMALGIVVTGVDGHRVGFGRATGRTFAKLLSLYTLFIGFLMAAFTQRKQALHDIIAGTLVLVRTSDVLKSRGEPR